ncbi:glycosyltransferase [Halomarina rubra]|uniref:Glycosyltransferase n=1 Tax=Halomarina rubra TaxID=2071873 RepID=A0ABD6AQV9_9EURY|nr:glycosyltransferase [Halomarina rubra]
MHLAIVVTETRDWRSLAPARETELTRRYAEQQVAAGHDVTVFCTQFWDGYESTLRRDGVTYRAVTVAPAATSFTARLPALLAAARPDVVHAAPTPPSAVLAAKQGARLASAPLVVGWEGHERPTGRLVGRAARAPDGVTVPSGLVGTRARKAGTPERRVRNVPQAIDADRVESVDPTGDYDVVTATPLDEHANLDGLLLALAELRRRDWSALVVDTAAESSRSTRRALRTDGGASGTDGSTDGDADGRPSDSSSVSTPAATNGVGTAEEGDEGAAEQSPRDRLAEQLDDLRIADRVTVVDGLDRDERLASYRGAHVFVQTRAREYFARELLWALACGCVGVVEYQADSSAHELLVDHPRGFRVTTPEEIETAIEDAADLERWTVDPEMRRYDWERVAEEYVEYYRELATA